MCVRAFAYVREGGNWESEISLCLLLPTIFHTGNRTFCLPVAQWPFGEDPLPVPPYMAQQHVSNAVASVCPEVCATARVSVR